MIEDYRTNVDSKKYKKYDSSNNWSFIYYSTISYCKFWWKTQVLFVALHNTTYNIENYIFGRILMNCPVKVPTVNSFFFFKISPLFVSWIPIMTINTDHSCPKFFEVELLPWTTAGPHPLKIARLPHIYANIS